MRAAWSSLLQFCTSIQMLVWVLRVGVGVFIIALFVLMWTRLGKTRVTHKCLVLSLFAHALLAAWLFLPGMDKIIGAAGPLGREGAPGIVGDHPTVLVAHVQLDDGSTDNARPTSEAVKPWQITPLRAAPPPASAGPEREPVDLATAPQRSMARPDADSLDGRRIDAGPLSPPSKPAPSQRADLPDDVRPAPPQESARGPQARSQPPTTPTTPGGGELRRERLPNQTPELRRQMPEASGQSFTESSRGGVPEPTPLRSVDRNLAQKAGASSVADPGTPAADAPTEASDTNPRASAADIARPAPSDAVAQSLADADRHGAEPAHEPKPTETAGPSAPARHELPQTYGHRLRADRQNIVRQQGGSPDTEAAVKSSLAWLAANQEADGHWDAAKHGAQWARADGGRDVQGNMQPDAGVTGLALLAFLGAGHTHQGQQYQDNIRRGLDYLVGAQAADGNLSGGATYYAAMYCHGMATLALAEAYGMTGDAKLLKPLRSAVAYTLAAQSPHHGGWRYLPKHAWGDTSQFGWQVMALKGAEIAGLEIPVASRHGMLRFLDSVSSGANGGLACYLCRIQADGTRFLDAPTPTMTAEALFCRFLLGTTADSPACKEAADYLLQNLPDERPDYYYWYYGTLSLYQLQGPAWETWNRAAQKRILNLQERNGSWAPTDRWGGHGGRVFSTAMATLTLEVYYRYVPATPRGAAGQESK